MRPRLHQLQLGETPILAEELLSTQQGLGEGTSKETFLHKPSLKESVPSTWETTSTVTQESTESINTDDSNRFTPITLDFDITLANDEDVEVPEQDQHEKALLQWHHRLGHLSFSRIQQMAKQGLLPKRLANTRVLRCAGCLCGKLTRHPWRVKGMTKGSNNTITCPGQCVSVDQLESTTLGLITQLKGIPTIARYNSATIFVDHYSGLSYVYLQQSLSSADTVQAKQAFEAYASSHGVTIQHHHADNGRFQDKAFRNAIDEKRQQLTFCGVNAHFQNGIVEKRIRDLQDNARTMLLHA